MSRIFKSIPEWVKFRNSDILKGKTIGFAPTMGALHQGHASLFEKSVKENDVTVASVFVNPTQFNDPKDLANYPKTFDEDLKILTNCKVDFVLYPSYEELYADEYRYKISENDFSKSLCGSFRPGHFEGVLTVVMKLLNLVRANHAYFGEKDYQQFCLINEMAKAFFLNTQIVPCPTIREYDGLAMSSRNRLLSTEDREKAPLLYKTLKQDLTIPQMKDQLSRAGFQVEYIEEFNNRRYAAAKLGNVRLIDNVEI
jgi:pantoate--beta-alanine ligase